MEEARPRLASGEALHHFIGHRRPFLTAKRLLSNQTFRDLYGTDTLDIDQRLKITSLTFLFTDLRNSTARERGWRRTAPPHRHSLRGALQKAPGKQSARPILHDLQKQHSRKLLVRHTARRGLLSAELAPHIDPAAEDGVIPSPRSALVLDFDYAGTR